MLVQPADARGLADALAAYVLDPALRRRHGAAGRAHVEAHYSVDAMVAGYDVLYGTLCARKAGMHPRGGRPSASADDY
jgi:glycosyltransferase involved in cell wall biosynthesis